MEDRPGIGSGAATLGERDEGEFPGWPGSLLRGAVDDVNSPGEDVAGVDGVSGRGEGHGDAEIRHEDGVVGVCRRGLEAGERIGTEDGRRLERHNGGRGRVVVAYRELRGLVGTLDARRISHVVETGVHGGGEVEGRGPTHDQARGAYSRGDLGRGRDGDVETAGEALARGFCALVWLDVVEEGDVVVGHTTHGQLHRAVGILVGVEALHRAVASGERNFVEQHLAFRVLGHVDLQHGDQRCLWRESGRPRESYPRVNHGIYGDSELWQSAYMRHQILLSADGGDS